MLNTTQNATVLLKRVLSLSDFSPLILCIDGIAQMANKLIDELVFTAQNASDVRIVYVSFETLNYPNFECDFIIADSFELEKLIEQIKSFLPTPQESITSKHLVILDAINSIPTTMISHFIASIASRHTSLLAVFHSDLPELPSPHTEHYPSSQELLSFMATSIIEVHPKISHTSTNDQLKEQISKSLIPRGLNNDIFEITLTNRRKSGRSLVYSLEIDAKKHVYEPVSRNDGDNETGETPEMLQDLTTFNLSTSAKQKLAKEQVDLPFLEAQSFNTGGAIVYQFEKDDDYDEEDPFEDPF